MSNTRELAENSIVIPGSSPIHRDEIRSHGDLIIDYTTEVLPMESSVYPIHHALPLASSKFVDYNNVISSIDEALAANKQIVLAGGMGYGKTETILNYAHNRKDKYELIAFIDATTQESLKKSYFELAKKLHLIPNVDTVIQELQNSQHNYLLVFDNVIHYDFIKPYLPKGKNVKDIIITTRLSDTVKWSSYTLIEMQRPNKSQAISLFNLHTGQSRAEDDAHLLDLIDFLEYSPFLISYASKLMMDKNLDPKACMDLLKENLWVLFQQNNIQNDLIILSSLTTLLIGLDEKERKLLNEISENVDGKKRSDIGLMGLMASATLFIHNLISRSDTHLKCYRLTSMVLKYQKEIEQFLQSALAAMIPEEMSYEIQTATGPVKSSVPSSSSSTKLVSENGQAFFERTHTFKLENNQGFKLGDKIDIGEVRAPGERKVIYTTKIPIASPEFPMSRHLLSHNALFEDWSSYVTQAQNVLVSHRGLVITGMAGIGKTQLANHLGYSYLFLKEYDLIHSMDAKNEKTLNESYLLLASMLHIDREDHSSTEMVAVIRAKLDHLGKKCLLIFDNVPDAKLVADYLPNSELCRVIITSRNTENWPYIALPLTLPTNEQAVKLLSNVMTDYGRWKKQPDAESEPGLKILIDKLGRLPASICQAGKYIKSVNISVEKYLKFFNENYERVWKGEGVVRDYNKVSTAWDADYALLDQTEISLLNHFAEHAELKISRQSLLELFGNNDSTNNALVSLCHKSMLNQIIDEYEIHPVFKLVCQSKMLAMKSESKPNYKPS